MHNHGPVSGPLSNNTAYSKVPRTPGMLELIVAEGDVGSALEAAILQVTPAASRNDMGIMVTEIQKGHFVVRAHPEVPCGLVRRNPRHQSD
jgi:hypothetical protein